MPKSSAATEQSLHSFEQYVRFARDMEIESITATIKSELDEKRWSVVSFDRREAGSLTYAQAVRSMSELDQNGVAGLCIVTDEAGERIVNCKLDDCQLVENISSN